MIVGCQNLTLTDNVFNGRAGTALFLHTKATGATISGNDMLTGSNGVRQSTAFGPYTPGVMNEVHYNNIDGNTAFGVQSEVTAGVQDIDATCNWWGSADGPAPGGSGDQVSAGVRSSWPQADESTDRRRSVEPRGPSDRACLLLGCAATPSIER